MNHDRAWSGLELCLVGQLPMVPMRLEQAIAMALPADEARLESFENYSDAFDFCRESQSVGLLLVLDKQCELTPEQVFSQLAKHYEQRGLPCLGVLVHTTLGAQPTYLADRRIFAQVNLTDFRDLVTTGEVLKKIWEGYTSSFQQLIVPTPLLDSLIAAASDQWSEQSLIFFERSINFLSSNLNLSWLEIVASRLYLTIEGAGFKHSVILRPHTMLRQIIETVTPDDALKSKEVTAQCTEKSPLAKRLIAVAASMTREFHQTGTTGLKNLLNNLPAKAPPGSTALLKQLVTGRERLLEFAQDGELQQQVQLHTSAKWTG